jgi:hypothetical protein
MRPPSAILAFRVEASVFPDWMFDDDDDRPAGSGQREVSFVAWLMAGLCLMLAYVLALVLLDPQA